MKKNKNIKDEKRNFRFELRGFGKIGYINSEGKFCILESGNSYEISSAELQHLKENYTGIYNFLREV